MKRFLVKYQRQLLAIVVIAVFVAYYLLNKSDFTQLSKIELKYLLLVGLGYVGIVITNGLLIKLVVRPFDVHLSTYESTRVSLISSLGNFFAAAGAGLGFRAVYLKKRHGLSYQQYLTTLYGNYLLIFIINASAGLISLLLTRQKGGTAYAVALLFFAGLLLAATALCFVPIGARKSSGLVGKILGNLQKMTTGWKVVAKDRKLLLGLSGLVAAQLLLTVGIIYFEMVALDLTATFAGLLLLSVWGALSVFINVTPANLGVKEGVYVLIASIVGLSTAQILSIALIDRGVLFVTLGLLWLLVARNRDSQEKLSA